MALDVDDPTAIPDILKIVEKSATALHVRADYKNVYQTAEPVKVHKIPDTILDLEKAVEWSLLYAPVEKQYPLATVSASSHKVVINSTHAFMDGGALVNIMNDVVNQKMPEDREYLPIPTEKVIEQELKEVAPLVTDFRDPRLTHFHMVPPAEPNYGDVLEIVSSAYPVHQLGCYTGGKVKGLTEWLSAAMILSSKAIRDLGDGFGVQTAVNVRQHLPSTRVSHNTPALAGSVAMRTQNPKTVGDLLFQLRQSLNTAIREKHVFGQLKWVITDGQETHPRNGLGIHLSHVGQLKVKRPIKDVMLRVSQEAPEEITCMLAYSVISEKKNILKTHINYGNETGTYEQMELFNKLVGHAVRNMKKSMTVEEAIHWLADFRKSL